MSPTFGSRTLARIRDDARVLAAQAREDEDSLESLVAAADTDVHEAELELSHALDMTSPSIHQLQSVLRLQLQRGVHGAHEARRLLVRAREQHRVAARLLSRVEGDPGDEEQHTGERPLCAAVLVADDYPDVREAVAEVLQNAGFVVRTAANGLEALWAAYEMRPEVIVMDVSMPVLDGLEATRLIKSTAVTRHARVIAYTGNPTLRESVTDNLFVAVLQKPATPDVVVATVRHVASM